MASAKPVDLTRQRASELVARGPGKHSRYKELSPADAAVWLWVQCPGALLGTCLRPADRSAGRGRHIGCNYRDCVQLLKGMTTRKMWPMHYNIWRYCQSTSKVQT